MTLRALGRTAVRVAAHEGNGAALSDWTAEDRETDLRIALDDRDRRIHALEARLDWLERRRLRGRRIARLLLAPLAVVAFPITLPLLARRIWRKRARADRKVRTGRYETTETFGAAAAASSSRTVTPLDVDAEEKADARPDDFALVRIIGNDLAPRHRTGQSRENLAFILEHEPPLADCRKLFLVNRIVDAEEERKIVALLEAAGASYRVLPFDRTAYAALPFEFEDFPDGFFASEAFEALRPEDRDRARVHSYRRKNNAVMHNNGARNAALDWARATAKWALPWDGNCFLTVAAWAEIVADIRAARDNRYFVTPMARLTDNAALLEPEFRPTAEEEPQIVFRFDAEERFDPAHPYGRRPKVELLCRLGVPGPWQDFPLKPWDVRPGPISGEAHRVGRAGWVARLFSGVAEAEGASRVSFDRRGNDRNQAIHAMLVKLDAEMLRAQGFAADRANFYRPDVLAQARGTPWADGLYEVAETALARGPFSVTHKTTVPPSGDRHDYWHPAPYFWPNPATADGLPYVRRDGERVPGTELYDAEADRYDRTRLQRLFDDTTALALAGYVHSEPRFAAAARRRVKVWFLDPATRMAPHLTFAQVRLGHEGNCGAASGLIEFKDLYFFLDAVRLLGPGPERDGLAAWLRPYARWLEQSRQGRAEVLASNNHGTCFDLQLAAIAAFRGDLETLQACYHRSQSRLTGQITAAGDQPFEMDRTLTQHYGAFNLQCWVNLFTLYAGCGLDPWGTAAAERLRTGLEQYLETCAKGWQLPQIKAFDARRLAPLRATAAFAGVAVPPGENAGGQPDFASAPLLLDPHDGVPPFWEAAGFACAPRPLAADDPRAAADPAAAAQS